MMKIERKRNWGT